jgi:hypothetical protein
VLPRLLLVVSRWRKHFVRRFKQFLESFEAFAMGTTVASATKTPSVRTQN